MYYLYIKTHNITGLKYLGYTSAKDPYKYKGSGKFWSLHIKKHGYDVTTIILLASPDKKEIKVTGEFFSKLFNVVSSSEWANMKLETCDGGWDFVNKNITEARRIQLAECCKIVGSNNVGTVSVRNTRGEILRVTAQEYKNSKDLVGSTKGSCFLYDIEGKKYKTETNSKPENLHGNNYGKIYINNNIVQKMINKTDTVPEGWLIGKLPTTNKHNKGKIWITNGIDSKMVFKDDSLPEGWRRGRSV
jgi:hypothetical protein